MLENNNFENFLNQADKESKGNHNHKRKSLGRGLGALLGDDNDDIEMSNKTFIESNNTGYNFVNINEISPSPFQPRKEFDNEALTALSESIKEKGVLQPLLVRKVDGKYELIAGERRLRASKLAGLHEVPVIEKEMNDKEVLEVALVENLLRENLSAIDEAEGFQRLISEFSHTQEAISQIVGKSRSHISNTLRLLNLPESIKEMIKDNKLSAGHGRALVGLENSESIAKEIVQKELSVRQVEELVSKQKANPATPETKTKKEKNEDIEQIEKSLIENLGLRIKISSSKQGGGKVVLQYSSIAELDMIIDILEQKRKNDFIQPQNTVFKAPEAASTDKFSIKMVD